jgi:hypothetical protein
MLAVAVLGLCCGVGVLMLRLFEHRWDYLKRFIDQFAAVREHAGEVGRESISDGLSADTKTRQPGRGGPGSSGADAGSGAGPAQPR